MLRIAYFVSGKQYYQELFITLKYNLKFLKNKNVKFKIFTFKNEFNSLFKELKKRFNFYIQMKIIEIKILRTTKKELKIYNNLNYNFKFIWFLMKLSLLNKFYIVSHTDLIIFRIKNFIQISDVKIKNMFFVKYQDNNRRKYYKSLDSSKKLYLAALVTLNEYYRKKFKKIYREFLKKLSITNLTHDPKYLFEKFFKIYNIKTRNENIEFIIDKKISKNNFFAIHWDDFEKFRNLKIEGIL